MAEFLTNSLTKAGLMPDIHVSQPSQDRFKRGGLTKRYLNSRHHNKKENYVHEKDFLSDTISLNPVQSLKRTQPKNSILQKKYDQNSLNNSQQNSQTDVLLNNPFSVQNLILSPKGQQQQNTQLQDNSLITGQEELDSNRSLDTSLVNINQKTDFKDLLKTDSIMQHRQNKHMEMEEFQENDQNSISMNNSLNNSINGTISMIDDSNINNNSDINNKDNNFHDISDINYKRKNDQIMELDHIALDLIQQDKLQQSLDNEETNSDEKMISVNNEDDCVSYQEEKIKIKYYIGKLKEIETISMSKGEKNFNINKNHIELMEDQIQEEQKQNSKVKFKEQVTIFVVDNWKKETKEQNYNRKMRYQSKQQQQSDENIEFVQRHLKIMEQCRQQQLKDQNIFIKAKLLAKKYIQACCECRFM